MRSTMRLVARASALARFAFSTHAERLSASFRSAKQTESCNAICITVCLATLARFLKNSAHYENDNSPIKTFDERLGIHIRFAADFTLPRLLCALPCSASAVATPATRRRLSRRKYG